MRKPAPESSSSKRTRRVKNTKNKGTRLERKTKARFKRKDGWITMRAAASLGPADIVALNLRTREVKMIQVKSNRWPGADEFNELRALANECHSGEARRGTWTVTVERWDDYQRAPRIEPL